MTERVERDARALTSPLLRDMMGPTFDAELRQFRRENANDIELLRTVVAVRSRRDARTYLGDSPCDLGEDLWARVAGN